MDQAQRLDALSLRLARAVHGARTLNTTRLAERTARLLRHPPQQALAVRLGLCQKQEARLLQAIAARLAAHRERLAKRGATLHAVSPLATLARGYAIVTARATGRVVRAATALERGDAVTARFARGAADCQVLCIRAELGGAEIAP